MPIERPDVEGLIRSTDHIIELFNKRPDNADPSGTDPWVFLTNESCKYIKQLEDSVSFTDDDQSAAKAYADSVPAVDVVSAPNPVIATGITRGHVHEAFLAGVSHALRRVAMSGANRPDLEELLRLADAASPGPWTADPADDEFCISPPEGSRRHDAPVCVAPSRNYESCTIYDGNPADAAFISACDPICIRTLVHYVLRLESMMPVHNESDQDLVERIAQAATVNTFASLPTAMRYMVLAFMRDALAYGRAGASPDLPTEWSITKDGEVVTDSVSEEYVGVCIVEVARKDGLVAAVWAQGTGDWIDAEGAPPEVIRYLLHRLWLHHTLEAHEDK